MTFTDVRKALAEQKPGDELPCAWCGEMTALVTLSSYGARCGRCFAAYCRDAFPSADVSKVMAVRALRQLELGKGDPKAWARRLIERHEAGEVIRPYNLSLAREALAGEPSREPGEEG